MSATHKQIDYYQLDQLDAKAFQDLLQLSVTKIENFLKESYKNRESADLISSLWLNKLATTVFNDETLSKLLLLLARLPVFSKDFEDLFREKLDTLNILKKLKFFVNLKIREILYLLAKLSIAHVDEDKASKMDLQAFFSTPSDTKGPFMPQATTTTTTSAENMLLDLKFKTAIRQDLLFLPNKNTPKRNEYLQEFDHLEKIEPHAIYPTSVYRQSDGYCVATQDAQKIEAVMSTTLTTSIRIALHVLGYDNNLLAEIYRPLGRVVIVLDDKLNDDEYTLGYVQDSTNHRAKQGAPEQQEGAPGWTKMTIRQQIDNYFRHHGVETKILIKAGNEVDKDIENVQQILVDLKKLGVMRNEPVLVVGGGVIADIAGFACALFHRNTPYVMLATSIVAGIDAGPSPRTCCDGQGYKNAFGAFHPPVLTLTDRSLWNTMHAGMIRHGIAEIVKMAVVENRELFELLEKVGPKFLVKTKFGTDVSPITEAESTSIDLDQFDADCEHIVGMAMESYVRAEYGNLWETHQCRPHAYGHTWSPGYELSAGLLHGHAVATCMGFGAYLSWKHCDWISEEKCHRICKLISDLELSLWHDIMSDEAIFHSCTKKMVQKRGGNLAAPLPRGDIGECGYLNDITDDQLSQYVKEYKAYVTNGEFARNGCGVEPLLDDVGLGDTGAEATAHVRAEILHDQLEQAQKSTGVEALSGESTQEAKEDVEVRQESYQKWIKSVQSDRNSDWRLNVTFDAAEDTPKAPHFPHHTLFHNEAENYAMKQTTVASPNIRVAAKITLEESLFAPCMVGTLESQFLKMFAKTTKAKTILDVGTFTGMSAIAFAEGALAVRSVDPTEVLIHTLENDGTTAAAAKKIFNLCEEPVKNAIQAHHCDAIEWMRSCAQDENGLTFDIIFIDADKDNYLAYYELAMGDSGYRPLLAPEGTILADNTLSALVYDEDDSRREALHLFNQHVKNDPRVEQAVMTVREGVSIIGRV